jgi:phosphatidylinositol alpha-1,6-mannosyltransferase
MRFHGAERRKNGGQVIAVARLVPEHAYKGVDTLLRAWPAVRRAVPHAKLTIVGDGPDRLRLEREAARLNLNGSVRFAGRLDDGELALAYVEAALFALPVRTSIARRPQGEGFGLAFLEASAAGLPVVAGAGGAIPELVKHGETGLLVDPNDPDQVAGAIVRLLRDPELAGRMGRNARKRALDFFTHERFRDDVAGLVDNLRRG